MKYPNIKPAKFLRRPNRFIAEVELDGTIERVHVKNTGRCRELLIPGAQVWLTEPGSPGRKTRYDLVTVRKSNGLLINMDSQAPNAVAREWLERQGFERIVPEYTYGNSRIDFYLERLVRASVGAPDGVTFAAGNAAPGNPKDAPQVQRYLMEVKGCTLEEDGIGYFPDAPTIRGTKHLRELACAAADGYHAILAFVIQMDGITEVRPNTRTDQAFAEAMEEAKRAGAEILFLRCHVEPDSLEVIEGVGTADMR